MAEEILFPKEEIAYIKKDLEFTKDDFNRSTKYLTDEVRLCRDRIDELKNGTVKSITRIHVVRSGLMSGIIVGIIGFLGSLLLIPFIGLLAMIPGMPPGIKLLLGTGGILLIILFTVSFFVLGLIGEMIEALVYNFVASIVGGMKYTYSDEKE